MRGNLKSENMKVKRRERKEAGKVAEQEIRGLRQRQNDAKDVTEGGGETPKTFTHQTREGHVRKSVITSQCRTKEDPRLRILSAIFHLFSR